MTETSPGVKNTEANKVESDSVSREDQIKRPNEADDGGDNDADDDKDDEGDERGDEELAAKEEVSSDLSKEELALRIYNTITSTILPQLHKCVTKKVSF